MECGIWILGKGEIKMTDKYRVRIEINDSTTSHNGNISIEFESKTLDVIELEALAVETIKKVKRK